MSIDMSDTIIPKSDQLNSDDLIAGPITVMITRVYRCTEGDQPIAVNFDGDGGKPYKPCKSMRRVMVYAWGTDATAYAGRSMTLYRDPSVTWGGMAVGGIRISHMSNIDRDMTVVLSESKKKRAPFIIRRMMAPETAAVNRATLAPDPAEPNAQEAGGMAVPPVSAPTRQDRFMLWLDALEARLQAATTMDEIAATTAEMKVPAARKALAERTEQETLDAILVAATQRVRDHQASEPTDWVSDGIDPALDEMLARPVSDFPGDRP